MAVNADFVGRTYPPTDPYLVRADAVTAFAGAVRAEDRVHHDSAAALAAGHGGLVAPPTFAVVVAQRCDAQFVTDPEAAIDFTRVVHGEQRFEHHRPIVAGDVLVGVLHVDSVREAGGHAMVTTRSELSTVGGEPVCTATSMIVIRGGE